MADLELRKKLVDNELTNLYRQLKHNQEYISLFQKNNDEITAKIINRLIELQSICDTKFNQNN